MYGSIVNNIMGTDKTYYHVIEEGYEDQIISHGHYDNQNDADIEANELGNFFLALEFYVLKTNTPRTPEFCTR